MKEKEMLRECAAIDDLRLKASELEDDILSITEQIDAVYAIPNALNDQRTRDWLFRARRARRNCRAA